MNPRATGEPLTQPLPLSNWTWLTSPAIKNAPTPQRAGASSSYFTASGSFSFQARASIERPVRALICSASSRLSQTLPRSRRDSVETVVPRSRAQSSRVRRPRHLRSGDIHPNCMYCKRCASPNFALSERRVFAECANSPRESETAIQTQTAAHFSPRMAKPLSVHARRGVRPAGYDVQFRHVGRDALAIGEFRDTGANASA